MNKIRNRKNYLKSRRKQRTRINYGMFLMGECPLCGEESKFYYERYDAVCCLSCNEWIEKACDDPECPYCANRPTTPNEAEFYEKTCPGDKEWRRRNYMHKADGQKRKNRHF